MATTLGLRFKENMYGHYEALAGPAAGQTRRFVFHCEVETGNLFRSLRDGRGEMTGWVEAEGLVSRAAMEGGYTVVTPIVKRTILYEFHFVADDGQRYRFRGQKAIRHLRPRTTWTTLPGAIFDAAGKEWARTLSRFDLREAVPFLLSFRLPLVRS